MTYHQNSAGHGGRRCETTRKTEVKIHGHHQEGHQKESADGRQHSRPQELEIGSVQGDPLTWKSLQGEKVRLSPSTRLRKLPAWSYGENDSSPWTPECILTSMLTNTSQLAQITPDNG